ncbi:MAG: hypothetical protein JWN07_2442, partial [Hyphomicrobiales bacterium]|nr:hypothetical protein [Hyphomicrobiales bacterium]
AHVQAFIEKLACRRHVEHKQVQVIEAARRMSSRLSSA